MIRAAMAAPASPPEKVPLLAEAGFLCLLLLLLVTLHPFVPPKAAAPVISAIEPVASDSLRQISFTAVFLMAFAAALLRPGAAMRAMPWSVALLMGWCLLSATWADSSGVVFRRAILIIEVTMSALISTALLGPERAFERLRQVLVLVLVINWISIPLVHTAVHLPGELDTKLIGNWRGLYEQKNVAGAVCALTVLLFLFPGARARRWSDWLVIAASIGFLVMTKSKTSMSLLPVAAAFGVAYRQGWKNGLDRMLLTWIGIIALTGIAALAILNTDLIVHVMQDPDAFTGRTEIWQADFSYLRDHFLFGAGFEGVFATGGRSPLMPYLHGRNWVADVSNSHNGYLDTFVSLGAIGFVIALLALLVMPFVRFWSLNADRAKAGYFAIFAFVIFHNFTEADFLAPDGVLWMVFLMVLCAIERPGLAASPVPQARPAPRLGAFPQPASRFPL